LQGNKAASSTVNTGARLQSDHFANWQRRTVSVRLRAGESVNSQTPSRASLDMGQLTLMAATIDAMPVEVCVHATKSVLCSPHPASHKRTSKGVDSTF
jgi:hypothetical protein